MLIVNKIAQALSAIDYPTYPEWLEAHEYNKSEESLNRWTECKEYKKALLACFTVDELKDLFILTHENNV